MNPELLRNLWLEFSVRRLIAMPLVLGLIFATPLIVERPQLTQPSSEIVLFASPFPDEGTSLVVKTESAEETVSKQTTMVGRMLFNVTIGVLLFLWGTRLAADALFAEVNGRTWDSQRSSTVGPWAMTVGKLFGSTCYVWYGAFFCVAFWAYLRFSSISAILITLIAGLWTQALALFVALLLLRMAPDRGRFRVTLAQAVVLPVAAILLFGSIEAGQTHWYGLSIRSDRFELMSLLLAAGWTIVGIYQSLRVELQLKTGPTAWIGFLIAIGLYVGGFAVKPGLVVGIAETSSPIASLARCLLLAGVAITVMGWIGALMSPPQLLPLQRLMSPGRLLLSRWRDIPAWLWAVLLAAVSIAVSAALTLLGAGTIIFGGVVDGPALLAAILLLLFALRDIAILHMMSLNPTARRGVIGTIVILALSYVVLPLLAYPIHASDLILAVRPDFLANPAWAIGVILAEVIFFAAVAGWIFRRFARLMPAIGLAVLALTAPAKADRWSNDDCPRTSGHEMLIEASLVFEGRLLSQGPPPECGSVPAMCGQEIFSFQVDRVLKGDAEAGDTITARRVSVTGRMLNRSDPHLAVPDSGLFALGRTLALPVLMAAGLGQSNYTLDECLLGIPADFAATAEAYAAKRDSLRSAADMAPGQVGPTLALLDYGLRYRDDLTDRLLQKAVAAFPASQAIRAQYLYLIDPTGMLTHNPSGWNLVKTQLPEAVLEALRNPTDPDPGNPWVQRLAIRIRARPAEAGSPLRALTDFSAYSFNGLQFAGASLRNATFADGHITNSDFRGADLSGADLRWAEFDNVDLSFARLADADLSDWNPATRNGNVVIQRLRRIQNLSPLRIITPISQFSVKLLRATLDRAKLERATLIDADLRQASLRYAILRGADLRQADLRGADLTGADLTDTRLTDARFDCRTKWPDGSIPASRPDPGSDTMFCAGGLITNDRLQPASHRCDE